jgi:nicotinate-nucleotide adenylyltransferase
LRLAIFGGTFDPIHNAHLAVATAAANLFVLDRVLLVPAAEPPHKQSARASYGHRLAMVGLAAHLDPRFEASDLEAGTARSYSILTIEKVRERLAPQDRLFFLIGADAFDEIETWYRREDVFRAVEFIVMTRPGHSYNVPDDAKVHRLDGLALPVSSSEIRWQLLSGQPVPELPDSVRRYIEKHRLYASPAEN